MQSPSQVCWKDKAEVALVFDFTEWSIVEPGGLKSLFHRSCYVNEAVFQLFTMFTVYKTGLLKHEYIHSKEGLNFVESVTSNFSPTGFVSLTGQTLDVTSTSDAINER